MADDASHLEKMARELKCPICLSLLKSAASIACNHVFCNSCILKSMNKESNCPVCKIPFHRREIRPAPHMDNLVGIYKSMETASAGVNMFMSESAPSSQLPEKVTKAGINVQNDTQRYSDNHVRSSFPSQKRVQVAHYPLPETPVHSTKIGCKNSERMPGEHQISIVSAKSNRDQSDRPGACLSPFFWLKDDEDAEDLSLPSEGTFEPDVTPPAAISFSDMKDSDKDSPFKENTQGESHEKFPAVDLSEWTQRPCSPELCPMSTNFEIKSGQEKQPEGASHGRDIHESHQSVYADHLILGQATSWTTMQLLDSAADEKPKTQNPSKRKKNARKSQTTSMKSTYRPATPLDNDGPSNNQDPVLKPHRDFPNSEKNTKKRRKKSTNFITAQESILSAPTGNSWSPSDKDVDAEFPKLLEQINKCKSKNTSYILRSREQNHEPSKIVKFRGLSDDDNNKKKIKALTENLADDSLTCRMQKRTSMNEPSEGEEKGSHIEVPRRCISKSCLRSRRQDLKPTKIISHENRKRDHVDPQLILEDSSLSSQQQDMSARVPPNGPFEVEGSPAVSPLTVVEPQLVSREKSGKYHSQTKISSGKRNLSRLKNSAVELSGITSIIRDEPSSSSVRAKYVPGNSGENTDTSTMQGKRQSPVELTDLRKCEPNLSKIHCAFCQSAEDSKPYGRMFQYFDGQPVSSNHNEGSKMINCHQICAEWAPNVYFKDDNAMNLKAEVARSKRISCSCCGVKGAALGCYDKSCHRSFHVPCAKLMPECRWDSENFVMLCPLHASSKLPCETSGSQKKRKRAIENKSRQESVMTTDIPKSIWKGDSHRSAEKIVLCCSALADVDKDIVAQFKMLSGVRESNKWSSNVTHVVASVDENEACRRTLKVLMGILEGKWILSVKWIKACLDAKRFVNEQQYEISVDIHGIKGGPRLGRLRAHNKEPKLFHGLEFYLCGDFAASYKGYLQDLITAGGGTILHRKPIVADQSRPSAFILYNLEVPEKQDVSNKDERIRQANALASSAGAKAASSAWILNSIAACELQNNEE